MADPSTPLGQAQAAALAASTEGPKDGSAYRAVEAAKQYAGVTVSLTYEAGLQALDPRNFSGPMWEQLTGIKSNVVELSWPDLYSKAVAEHIAGSGAYDILDIAPMWTPSLADGGVIQPLDDYIAKYMNVADLEDYHPLYKALPTYKGKIWGFFDDGDVFALYYRKDIFEDPKVMEAYQAKFGKALAPPTTWKEYAQIAQFITDNRAPNVYGAGHFRKAGSPGNQFDFLQQFRANGGQLFDENMKAQLASPAGIKTLENMIAANAASIPGNNELDAVSLWAAFLTGKVAMIYSWPPSGRMSAGYSQTAAAINFIPQSQIAGKVGYAVVPGNPGTRHRLQQGAVGGFGKPGRRLPDDAVDDLAAGVAGEGDAALRAPRPLPPVALQIRPLRGALARRQGLSRQPQQLGQRCPLDPIIPGAQDYFLSIDRMATSVWAGTDPKAALETAAAEFDATTERLGVNSQKAYYPSS